ncbi:MAG TPA: transcription antitermination factor NusB [Bacteroidales bacterium]|nr:transcription antitermination factor NusB [Bacteroidales bacterium]
MLSRRHLRIKVLQALYAFIQSDNDNLAKGEKQLLISIEKIRDLIVYQLSFLIEIRDYTSNLLVERKKKYFPTEEDLNPNFRFVQNKALIQLEDNRAYRKLHDKLKINWADEQNMVRKAYLELRDKSFFNKYMDKRENTYDDDRELLIKIVKKFLGDYELLEYYYESKSIFWAFDSFHTANLMLMKFLKSIEEKDDEYAPFPEMLDSSDAGEDKAFMIELFRKTIRTGNQYEPMIDEKARNWELDRIALMDTLLIKMALVELVEFPSIPVKVTLNEYIDISKYYSSEKSKVFINGILDKLIVDLREKNMIRKTGRGLME